uniref:Uncharacterized protein n=1 Tax=Vespula pensylvanica TaxID=30213 RepID=A0A834NZT4_VESPE|nr:hypothetical protein H0235_009719 [Vespula pensylvanica]
MPKCLITRVIDLQLPVLSAPRHRVRAYNANIVSMSRVLFSSFTSRPIHAHPYPHSHSHSHSHSHPHPHPHPHPHLHPHLSLPQHVVRRGINELVGNNLVALLSIASGEGGEGEEGEEGEERKGGGGEREG